jgi:hypothetical protein
MLPPTLHNRKRRQHQNHKVTKDAGTSLRSQQHAPWPVLAAAKHNLEPAAHRQTQNVAINKHAMISLFVRRRSSQIEQARRPPAIGAVCG